MITKFTALARKLPAPIYKVAAQSYIDYEFPRHIFIETTANCNLACAYCPREKNKENMDYELFRSIVDECSTHGPRSFSLHLFGEPLLYPHILDAIRYIKKETKEIQSFLQQMERCLTASPTTYWHLDATGSFGATGKITLTMTPYESFEKSDSFVSSSKKRPPKNSKPGKSSRGSK